MGERQVLPVQTKRTRIDLGFAKEPAPPCAKRRPMREITADVAVIGGGLGGVAAAWAALRQGKRVFLSEEYAWLGGQMTSQAVPPDEHPWIEQFGCTASYRKLREEVRKFYRRYYPLTDAARANPRLNPGNGFVSQLCHEPKVSLAVIEAFLRPYESGLQLTVARNTKPVKAESDGDKITSVTLSNGTVVTAPYFIDATEQGDLLPLAGVEYVTGAEAQSETGEPHAKSESQPANLQAVSWCFVLDYQPDRDNTIPKPANYDFWQAYVPPLTPDWGSPFLSWQATHPITLEPVVRTFDPVNPKPERGPMDLWTFRRIADRANFREGAYQSDICLVNWPQIDYCPGNLIDVSPEDEKKHREGARELSRSMLYWMQTTGGWPGLRLRPDITGTADGLAMAPYIRESRRIKGLFTVVEQHVASDLVPRAVHFPDSVGIGAYRIDLHPSTGGDNYIDVGAHPFQIPLGALIPQRVENLLAGAKNLSVTHITNGCYRLHPVEWNVGEAAGMLAAHCLDHGLSPRQVREDQTRLSDFQARLRKEGFELEWPQLEPL